MISDKLDNLGLYAQAVRGLPEVLDYLGKANLAKLEPGRHDFGASGCFALVFDYRTRPAADCIAEAHRKYIDLHLVLEGAEGVGVRNVEDCALEPYVPDTDFIKASGKLDEWRLRQGYFAILFPHEAHATGIALNGAEQSVRKLVVKIPAAAA